MGVMVFIYYIFLIKNGTYKLDSFAPLLILLIVFAIKYENSNIVNCFPKILTFSGKIKYVLI